MVTVSLPRDTWDSIEIALAGLQSQGFIVEGLLKAIQDQTQA